MSIRDFYNDNFQHSFHNSEIQTYFSICVFLNYFSVRRREYGHLKKTIKLNERSKYKAV